MDDNFWTKTKRRYSQNPARPASDFKLVAAGDQIVAILVGGGQIVAILGRVPPKSGDLGS